MTWVAAGVAAATIVYGGYQKYKASKIQAPQDNYQIPESKKEELKRKKLRAAMGGEMPGQNLIEQKIGASTSKGITAMKETGNQANFQAFIADQIQREQDQLSNLGIEASKYKLERELDVDNSLLGMADEESKQQNRKFEKQAAKLAEKQALSAAGDTNISSGVQLGASILGNKINGGAGGTGERQNNGYNRKLNRQSNRYNRRLNRLSKKNNKKGYYNGEVY